MTPLQRSIELKIHECLLDAPHTRATQDEFTSDFGFISGNAPGTFDFYNEDWKTPLRLVCRPPEDIVHQMRDHRYDLEKNQTRLIIALVQLGANPSYDADAISAIYNVVSAMDIDTVINTFAECEQKGINCRDIYGANPLHLMVPSHIIRLYQLLAGNELSEHTIGWMYEPHPQTGRDVMHEIIHHALLIKRPSITDNHQRQIKNIMNMMIELYGSTEFMQRPDTSGKTAAQSLAEAIETGKIFDAFHESIFAPLKSFSDRIKIDEGTAPLDTSTRPRARL